MRLLVLLLLVPCMAMATVYYVRVDGSDANAGTANTSGGAWLTISNANRVMVGGDTVFVGAGSYGEDITTARSGTNSPITFDGQGVATTKRFNFSKTNIVVKGFTLTGYNTAFGAPILMSIGGHYARIQDNVIDNADASSVRGIQWAESFNHPFEDDVACHCVISNNVIKNVFGSAMVLLGGVDNVIVNNVLTNAEMSDDYVVFGISNVIRGNVSIGYNPAVVSGNHPDHFNTQGGILNSSDYATAGHNISKYMLIENNKFFVTNYQAGHEITIGQLQYDNPAPGPDVPSGTCDIHDWIIRNNLFIGEQGAATIGIPSLTFVNNTFYRIWTNAPGGPIAICFGWATNATYTNGYLHLNATNAIIMNNVFLACGNSAGSGWYMIGDSSDFVTNSWVTDYNYVGAEGGTAKTAGPPKNNGHFVEAHGINGGDPKLNDLLEPMLTSPLIDAGTNYFAITPKGSGVDIGYAEFDPSLLLHLDFNVPDTNKFDDVTGYGGTAWRFNPTNWVTYSNGVAQFTTSWVWNVGGNNYDISANGAITNNAVFAYLTNGTISAWAQFNHKVNQNQSFLIDNSFNPASLTEPDKSAATNSWRFERITGRYMGMRAFPLGGIDSDGTVIVDFPVDSASDGSTASLALYTVTFSCTNDGTGGGIAYRNGVAVATNTFTGLPWLRSFKWTCIGSAARFGGTPQWFDDLTPDDAFHNGQLDDVRIYNRALSPAEVANLFTGNINPGGGGGGSPTPVSGFHALQLNAGRVLKP